MKARMRKRMWMSLVLAAALLILPVSSSYAASVDMDPMTAEQAAQIDRGGAIDPQYINTSIITADLSITGKNAYVYAHAIAKRVCPITITMRLQRKEGNSWVTKVSWVGSSNTGDKSMGRSHTLTQRGTYRTYAIFNVDGEELTYKSVTQVY